MCANFTEDVIDQAVNYRISHCIGEQLPHSLFGLEDLTHIRERTKRSTGKKATRKQRRANQHASRWAFAQLQGYIAYKALLFWCQGCHYRLHADLVGARNIALRTLVSQPGRLTTGVLEVSPDVASGEAKAAHRQRYVELRWSLATSPRLSPCGH